MPIHMKIAMKVKRNKKNFKINWDKFYFNVHSYLPLFNTFSD